MKDIGDLRFTVYAVRCIPTGKIYVGSTKDFELRIYTHYSELSRGEKTRLNRNTGKYEPSPWQIDYNKYGESAFQVYILERDVKSVDRKAREEHWIAYYRATEPEYGYNYRATVARSGVYVEPGIPPRPEDGGENN